MQKKLNTPLCVGKSDEWLIRKNDFSPDEVRRVIVIGT